MRRAGLSNVNKNTHLQLIPNLGSRRGCPFLGQFRSILCHWLKLSCRWRFYIVNAVGESCRISLAIGTPRAAPRKIKPSLISFKFYSKTIFYKRPEKLAKYRINAFLKHRVHLTGVLHNWQVLAQYRCLSLTEKNVLEQNPFNAQYSHSTKYRIT